MPLEAGQSIDVTEHHFLVATAALSYDWVNTVAWWAIGPKNQRISEDEAHWGWDCCRPASS